MGKGKKMSKVGITCPKCGNKDLEGTSFDYRGTVDGGYTEEGNPYTAEEIHCIECDTEFHAVFTYSHSTM
jgi:predicted nucleic-acid-binding Zn-ribbon protein